MRSVVLTLLPSLLLAQGGFDDLFQKAPPTVDKALRDRLAVFYQAHQDGKFRLADTVVHEDSKDIFFAADKSRFRGWKIVTINYEENFTRAKVVIDIDTDFMFPGFGKMAVHRPLSSTWRLDKGEWWWYVIPTDCSPSPFGTMCKGPDGASGGGNLTEMFNKVTPAALRNKLALDKKEVTLSSVEPSKGEITITSKFEYPLNLTSGNADLPGLEVALDKPVIKPGESVKLRFAYKPTTQVKKLDVSAWVRAEQIAVGFPITIHFSDPPNREPAPGTKIPVPPAKPN